VNALAKLYGTLISRAIDSMEEVLITGGAYGALYFAVLSNVGIGDEVSPFQSKKVAKSSNFVVFLKVIIIEPFFDCYGPLVQLAGGTPVFVALKPDETVTSGGEASSDSWKLDMKEFAALFNKNTKAIILNTPNNPLGKVFTRSELNVSKTHFLRNCQ
jgi:kynurenine--oxoglutarate transaminase/cysteine-S-conjugate beta-lyase/glutamine--phenylpyruvate transaminase